MIISIRIFINISLFLYFAYFSYANVLAQTNECPEIPSQQLTINQNQIPLFATPESNGEVAYIAKENETLQLLEPTAQYLDGICWYRVQAPDGISQSQLWLATQKEEKTPENPTPTSTPSTPSPIASPPEIKTEPILVPSPKNQSRKTPEEANKPSQNLPEDIQSKTLNKAENTEIADKNNQLIIVYLILAFVGLGSLGGIISFFYCLSLASRANQQSKQLKEKIELSNKQAKKLEEMSIKIKELEKKLILKEKSSSNLIDLEIINLLRKNGPMSSQELQMLSFHSHEIIQERLISLLEETLITVEKSKDTSVYSL